MEKTNYCGYSQGKGYNSGPWSEWKTGLSEQINENVVGIGDFMSSKTVVEGMPEQVSQKYCRLFESMVETY